MKPLQHILCVDDEDDILEIVKLCLEGTSELKVTCQSDVSYAVSTISSINPDLILLDMMMPAMNGVSAIPLFRQQSKFQDIPIILMTARVQKQEIQEYIAQGATAVILKPFDPMALADQIKGIWETSNG